MRWKGSTILTSKQKLVLSLHYRGLPQKDIAEVFHVRQPSISKTLKRAKGRVKKFAQACGAGSECAVLQMLLN